MAKKSLRVLKDGEEIYPSSISTRNIFDSNGLNLEEKIDSINNVTAAFSEGTTIATVNGTAIKVPNMSASQVISGTTIFNTISAMKSSTRSFVEGEILETKGYYQINDGGHSKFMVVSNQESGDDATIIVLNDGHRAKIMIPSSGVFNFRQFGAKSRELQNDFDCHDALIKYLNFIANEGVIYSLYIPGGVWQFSKTNITQECNIFGDNSQASLVPGKTVIVPISGGTQDYIWKVSGQNTRIINLFFTRSPYGIGAIKQMGALTTQSGYTASSCPTALVLEDLEDGYFDGIYFGFCLNCLQISNTKNTYIGYLNIRQSGGSVGGKRSVIRIGDNVQGLYIDYLNAEVISGNVFYGYGSDANSITQFIMNDLQMEGTHAGTSTNISDPGYSHSIGHWFIFNGKLGSADNPCILHSASISNLKSYNQYDNVSYKSMALFGHETNVPMGFIVGNVFVSAISGDGPWYIYDTQPGAYFVFNQPVRSTVDGFYLSDASMPLIQSIDRRDNIAPAAMALASRVSYKSGAVSAHGICGSNDAANYYELYSLNGRGFNIRFYNKNGVSKFTASYIKQINNSWGTTWQNVQVNCSTTVGWQVVSIPCGTDTNYPVKIRIKGLPKLIDYFVDYEEL